MWIKASRLQRGLYKVTIPEDYNVDDILFHISVGGISQALSPDGYMVAAKEPLTVTISITEALTRTYLDGGIYSVYAYVPTPFLVQTVVRPGAGRPPKAKSSGR